MEYTALCLGLLLVGQAATATEESVPSSQVGNHSQYHDQVAFISHFLLSVNTTTTPATQPADGDKTGKSPSKDDNNSPNIIPVIPVKSVPAVWSSVIDTLPVHPRIPRRSPARRRSNVHQNRHSTRVYSPQPVRYLLPPLEDELLQNTSSATPSPLFAEPIVVDSSTSVVTTASLPESDSETQQVDVKSEQKENLQTVVGPQHRRVFIPPPLRYLLPPFFYENYINAQPSTAQPSLTDKKPTESISSFIKDYYSSSKVPCTISVHNHYQNNSVVSSSVAPIIVIEILPTQDTETVPWSNQSGLEEENTYPKEFVDSEPKSEVELINNLSTTNYPNDIVSSTTVKTLHLHEPSVFSMSQFGKYNSKSVEKHSSRVNSPIRYPTQQHLSTTSSPEDGEIGAWNHKKTSDVEKPKYSSEGYSNRESDSEEQLINIPSTANYPRNFMFSSTTMKVPQFKTSSTTNKIPHFTRQPFVNISQFGNYKTSTESYSPRTSFSTRKANYRQFASTEAPQVSKSTTTSQDTATFENYPTNFSTRKVNYRQFASTEAPQVSKSSTTSQNTATFENYPINSSPRNVNYRQFASTEAPQVSKSSTTSQNTATFENYPINSSTRNVNYRQFASTEAPQVSKSSTDSYDGATFDNYPTSLRSTPTSAITTSHPILTGPNIEQALFETGDFNGFVLGLNDSDDSTVSMMNRPLLAQEVAQAGMKITAKLKEERISKGKLSRGRFKFNHLDQFLFQNYNDISKTGGSSSLSVAETSYYSGRSAGRHLAQEADLRVIPGRPGKDYPIFSTPPTGSEFSCRSVGHHRGYVADPSTGCQVFYICVGSGPGEAMLCPNGTLFSQDFLVCDWWYNVDCQFLT